MIEFTPAEKVRHCERAIDAVGRKLIDSSLKRFEGLTAIDQLQLWRSESTHPILEEVREFRRWLKAGQRAEDQRKAIRLAHLGWCLDLTHQQSGVQAVIDRLAKASECAAARYEIEVAAGYLHGGSRATFVTPQEGRKTPDLQIDDDRHGRFWVECKVVSRLDEVSAAFNQQWNEIEAFVQRALANERRGTLIVVLALVSKPAPVAGLIKAIREELRRSNMPVMPGIDEALPKLADLDFSKLASKPAMGGKYQIGIAQCGRDDLVFAGATSFSFPEDLTRVSLIGEVRFGERGQEYRNPRILLMGRSTKSEAFRSNAIRNAIASAASQLPQAGPGIVKVRLPDYHSAADRDSSFAVAQDVAQQLLRGGQNQRINGICFEANESIYARKGEESHGVALVPWQLTILHDSPRSQFANRDR